MASIDMSNVASTPCWEAEVDLEFERRNARTVLSKRQHRGPLTVQQPFYPEADVCHVYLLHPPGGIVGGDRLTIRADARPDTHAVVTTPAATKFYRSDGRQAMQQQRLSVGEEACLEWLPQETILFSGCEAVLETRVELAATSQIIMWEILCLGRPASGEAFDTGKIEQKVEIWRQDKPSIIERMSLNGGDTMCTEPWGLNNHAVVGTMIAGPADSHLVSHVRATIGKTDCLFGVTLLDDMLIARCLGSYSESVRSVFENVWTVIRPMVSDRPACPPRIWLT